MSTKTDSEAKGEKVTAPSERDLKSIEKLAKQRQFDSGQEVSK